MTWRIAESLKKLREQLNAAYPNRDTTSDGAIGDAAHASRSSDHNPWVKDGKMGVVTAIDIDEDLNGDATLEDVVTAIRSSRDKRVKYIIYEGRITVKGSDLQRWKKYTGSNAHKHHAHISVESDKKLYDSRAAWSIGVKQTSATAPAKASPAHEKGEQENKAEQPLPSIEAPENKPTPAPQMVVKEKASAWSKAWTTVCSFFSFLWITITGWYATDFARPVIDKARDNAANGFTVDLLPMIGIMLGVLIVIGAVAILFLWLGVWVWNHEKNRVNCLNERKLEIASQPRLATTEFTTNPAEATARIETQGGIQ